MLRYYAVSAYLAFTMTLAAAFAANASEQRIGAAAAVVPATSGTTVSGMSVQIIDGSNVFHRERVVTEAEGRAQLIFLDGSAVTIGPRSDVTLDEFVYDPDQRLAGATINASRGVLRYVGGKISKTVDVKINTPTATIGVRGGIVVVDIEQGGRTNAYFLYGERMSVTSDGMTEVAQRPGSIISLNPGRPPTAPRLASPGEMRQALNGLQAPGRPPPGQPGQARPGQNPQGQNQQGQPQQAGHQPRQQPGANQPGQNRQAANQGPNQQSNQQPNQQGPQPAQQGQPGSAQAHGPMGPGGGQAGPMMAGQRGPGPLGAPGNLDRGALAARSERNLPPALGGNNSRLGPNHIAPPSIGNFGRVGPPNGGQLRPRPNGPVGPNLGPRPVPVDGIPRLVQQGLPPPPPPPPPR